MRKVTRVRLIAALLLNTATVVYGQSGVPPENQARILDEKIAVALRSKNNQALIDYIEQYRKLGSLFSNDLLVIEAEASDNSGDPARALKVLNDYFKAARKTDKFYDEAISIYPQIESKAYKAIISAFVAALPGQMKRIPAGTFIMGTDRCAGPPPDFDTSRFEYHVCELALKKAGPHLAPAHRVSIPAFWMQQYPVSSEVLHAFAIMSGDTFWKSGENSPVSSKFISDFLRLLQGELHRPFRLPSEAEWEYAMVSGKPPTNPWEVCSGGLACPQTFLGEPPVPARENSFRIIGSVYGESYGSVLQIMADCWHDNYTGAPTDGSPWSSGQCDDDQRVVRGGNGSVYLRRPAASARSEPEAFSFRVVVSADRQQSN